MKYNKIIASHVSISELKDPGFSNNAIVILKNRYLQKDNKGQVIEEPKEMLVRVANTIAAVEDNDNLKRHWGYEFYNTMAAGEFMPNSPTLMNAGRSMGMLSACFVLPVEDNIQGIFGSISATALVQKAGGGTGFNFSKLRPRGSIVKSSGGTTTGPLSFIDVFSQATTAIQQGAFRRGANMGIINIDHPDVIEFIKAKEDLNRWQNYNISISITNKWMDDLKKDGEEIHIVNHPEWGEGELWKKPLDDGDFEVVALSHTQTLPDNYKAWTLNDTWNLICERAWQTGEPGLFFVDAANKRNSIIEPCGVIESTNPCGEVPLHAYDSCNLGSINLSKFYNKSFNALDYDKLARTVKVAVRFLDNVIDANNYPIPEITKMSRDTTRRIGLGVMGWADLLFKMNIRYGSSKSLKLAEEIQAFITKNAQETSEELGKKRGNFGAWEKSTYGKINRPMRNSFHTTVAPTGSISIIAGCSGGIEPLFALSFEREIMPDDSNRFTIMEEHNQIWEKAVKTSNIQKEEQKDILKYALKYGNIKSYTNKYSKCPELIASLKEVFVTAHDIKSEEHVDMQIAWQKHIDSSISKTVNISKDSSVEEVNKIYLRAYNGNCTGITVYRDGCRNNIAGMKQPMKTKATTQVIDEKITQKDEIDEIQVIKKSKYTEDMLPAIRTKIKTQFGNLHVNIVKDVNNNREIEIFAQLGKAGDLIAADIEAICRLSSKLLRSGYSLNEVIDQIEYIGTTHIMPTEYGKIVSMPDALAKCLKKYLKHKENNTIALSNASNKQKDVVESAYGVTCPSCSNKLAFQEGCMKCSSCGWSAC